MNDDLRDLYQETILDHYRHPRNFGAEAGAVKSEGSNPLCGDRVTVYVSLDEQQIKRVSFEGSGCAICMASASLMTERLKGLSVDEALQVFEKAHSMFLSDPQSEVWSEADELAALAGVREFPMRVKCATLPWHALRAALESMELSESQP